MRRVRNGFRGFAIAVGLALALVGSEAAGADRFFSTIEDLPVMPGLVEDSAAGMMFDKPGGRIATGVAGGNVARAAVAKFYDDALPELGWRKQDNGTYRRDEEMLRLDVTEAGPGVRVTVTVSPLAAQ